MWPRSFLTASMSSQWEITPPEVTCRLSHGDHLTRECTPNRIDRRRRRLVTLREPGQVGVEALARARVGFQEQGASQGPGLTEERRHGGAQLLTPERFLLEEGQLPAIERLRKRLVFVGESETDQELPCESAAERVEARRLSRRLRRCDRKNGADAERPAVERLEEHRARSERGGRRQAERRHGVRELRSCVRRLAGGLEVGAQLEDAEPVRLATEVA